MAEQDDRARYIAATHAMQSGVAFGMEIGKGELQPKSLRVGINAAMCDHAALVKLLISKGVVKEKEYLKAIADEMEREVQRYEERLGVKLA